MSELTAPSKGESKSFKKGYKYRIYPTAAQEELFNRTTGCCRYVWNRALAEAKAEFEEYTRLKELGVVSPPKPTTTGYDFTAKLPLYKADVACDWLNEVSAVALQQSLLHLGSAYSRFFKERKGYPKFKSKRGPQSFALMTTAFRIKDGEFYVSKCKDVVKVGWSRDLPSAPSSVVISKTATGKWYASFVCEYSPEKTSGNGIVGIDLGIKDFAALSTGEKISNPKYFARKQRLLKRRQQALSRKQKGSNNRAKARLAVAKVHEHIANSRNDFLHQLSRRLVNENQVIGMESLAVANMVKNKKLSKAIGDTGWSTLKQYVAYKAIESQHCTLVLMHAFYPSTHICSEDKIRLDRKLSLSERTWKCPHCGTVHDRDVNAALNIRDEAYNAFNAQSTKPRGVVLIADAKLSKAA